MAKTTAELLAAEMGNPDCIPEWLKMASGWLDFAYRNGVLVKKQAYDEVLDALETWVDMLVPHK